MSITSRILNILVLIAAIAAAVCAYVLFEKREQITKGREMMASSVSKAAKNLDPQAKISPDDMSIRKKPEELSAPLKVLNDQVQQILNQRKAVAEFFAEAVNHVADLNAAGVENVEATANDFTSYETYRGKGIDAAAGIKEKVAFYKERNEKVGSGMKSIATALEISDTKDINTLDNAGLGAVFSDYRDQTGKYVSGMKKLGTHVSSISEKMKLENTPNAAVSNTNLDAELQVQLEKVDEYVGKAEKAFADNERLAKEAEEAKALAEKKADEAKKALAKLKNTEKELAVANSRIKSLSGFIDDPNSALNSTAAASEAAVSRAAGNQDALRGLIGKVTMVNKEFGFVMIDLGTKSTVKKQLPNGKEAVSAVPLPDDALMTVTTSLDPEKAQYVSRIQVVEVGENYTIANILPTLDSKKQIEVEVGNLVFFSEADLKQMKEIREAAAKKAAEEAAAARRKALEELALTAPAASSETNEDKAEETDETDDLLSDLTDDSEEESSESGSADDAESDDTAESEEEEEE